MKAGYAAAVAAAAQLYDAVAGMVAVALTFFDGAGAVVLGILAFIGVAFDGLAFEDGAAAAAKGVDVSLMVLVEMLVGSAILAAAAALVRLAPCPLPFSELGLCPTRLGKTLAVLYAAGHTVFPAALYLTRKWAAGTA